MFVLVFSGARFRLCSLYLTPVLEFKTWKENRCKHHGNLIWKKKKNSSSNDVKPVLINVGLAPWGAPTLVQWGSPRWPPGPPSLQTSLRQWVDASPSAARDRTPLHLWVKTCFQHILSFSSNFSGWFTVLFFFVFFTVGTIPEQLGQCSCHLQSHEPRSRSSSGLFVFSSIELNAFLLFNGDLKKKKKEQYNKCTVQMIFFLAAKKNHLLFWFSPASWLTWQWSVWVSMSQSPFFS